MDKPEKNTSESRMGGQPILESQPEINMKVPSNHFDFGAILPMLSNLEEIYVCYKVWIHKSWIPGLIFQICSNSADTRCMHLLL